MRHHNIIARLGPSDTGKIEMSSPNTYTTDIQFIANSGLCFGLSNVLRQLRELGLRPSETSVDLVLLAAAITAADTRISRAADAQDAWTRKIDIHVPVQDPERWITQGSLINKMLRFLTGDRWHIHFRPRPPEVGTLAAPPSILPLATPSSVCLFSGGLDSFIGAIDLIASGESPILVSHYGDNLTPGYQDHCAHVLKQHYHSKTIHRIQARVIFPTNTIAARFVENSQRGRSFLFFALASLTADAIGNDMTVYVPENGLISLNVPLDRLRLGALSTRTTHPYYMARFDELLSGLGLRIRLVNPYAFLTKGQMAKACADLPFLQREAKYTMSCSSPGGRRYDPDPRQRDPKHCGRCVPCLIRRAAILEAWGVDDTPYRIPDLRGQILNTKMAEGEHVRSFQFLLSRLIRKPSRARLDILRPGPLTDHLDKLASYEAVYLAGMQEVGRLLEGVVARPL
ncbi:Qat anti-phage system QueC-like protein QatC [Desulfovibrio intestinalis]|uniref:7-cyano-7-deazaguanine synthase in queuosine biosynthesis n=1 Tax=Desulfovibrio intestinalis TaxID=58621 RepID=A0A7W8C3A8_9BACT|nr:Qat anti-phage system QueC-like protein QatC [Desulfovibrio intestinalis]MBB5143652.1 7-cyano-7-deazaguanine synthase in queuosine biosynthesis [Desulfovibrio intestinalis]